jgi:hypothetical protein
MTNGKLPHAQPGDFNPQDRHWLKLMAKMLRSTQQESAALAAAAAAAGVGTKGVKGGEGSSSSGAGAFSAALLVTEQDVLDVMFTVKVREGMDAVMVSGGWGRGALGVSLCLFFTYLPVFRSTLNTE